MSNRRQALNTMFICKCHCLMKSSLTLKFKVTDLISYFIKSVNNSHIIKYTLRVSLWRYLLSYHKNPFLRFSAVMWAGREKSELRAELFQRQNTRYHPENSRGCLFYLQVNTIHGSDEHNEEEGWAHWGDNTGWVRMSENPISGEGAKNHLTLESITSGRSSGSWSDQLGLTGQLQGRRFAFKNEHPHSLLREHRNHN